MGWEVFHQVILIFIPTPICSTKLTSKRESNCNIMITGPVDHGLHVILSRDFTSFNLHVTYQLHISNLHHLRYKLFFTLSHRCYNLISLILTWLSISTSFFWSKNLTCHRLLADQRLSKYGSSGAKEVSSRFTKKSH